MIDLRQLNQKIKRKVWDTFSTMEDEMYFLKRLRDSEPARFDFFMSENFTNEETSRIVFMMRNLN